MIVLRVIGGLYLLSGVWCLLQPELAAGFLDLAFASDAGKAEFVSVYGGLQIGFGIALWWVPAYSPEQQLAATRFATLISAGLFFSRCYALAAVSISPALIAMAVLEAIIALLLLWRWHKLRQHG